MLTEHLLGFTLLGAEWILWILIVLSLLSIALILERSIFFLMHRLPTADRVVMDVLRGDLDAVKAQVGEQSGLQAAVLRAGLGNLDAGAEAVEQIIAATVSRERKRYERGLAFLGTLGANAPFIGLFGTVLGIIKAFHELAQATGRSAAAVSGGAPAVMAGISEALVATAVGLMVAIPAVVAFNGFNRWLGTLAASANELGHAIIARLHTSESRA